MLVGLAWKALRKARPQSRIITGTSATIAIMLVLVLGASTIYYSRFWANNQVLYGRAITVAPNNNLAVNNYAGLRVARGDYAGAIPFYASILARDNNSWLANFNLGHCFYKLGRLNDAERYLQRAAAIDVTLPDPFLYLGLVRMKSGRIAEAESEFRRALALRPDGRGYHFALGMALKLQGALVEARREFQLELVNNPGAAAARAQIAEIDSHSDTNPLPQK